MLASLKSRATLAIALLVCAGVAVVAIRHFRHHAPLAAPASGTPPAILADLPPDAPVLCYIDVAALRKLQSPLATVLGLTGPTSRSDPDYAAFVRGTGFDYSRDLDRVAIAFWPQTLAPQQNTLAKNRALALAEGRFDRRKIASYALKTGKLLSRGSEPIYEVPGAPPVAFEFLTPSRIAIASGDRPEELLALARAHASDPSLQASLTRVSKAPVFAAARTDDLPATFYNSLADSAQLDRLARSIRRLTLAINLPGDGLDATLDAECDSPTSAFELSTMLDFSRLFASAAISGARKRRQIDAGEAQLLDALVQQVRITHENQWVRLSLTVGPQSPSNPAVPDARPAPAAH